MLLIEEMFMDRVAACKVYKKEAYTDCSPLEYYQMGKDPAPMHEYTREVLEKLLIMLAEKGEKETCQYIRDNLVKK